MYFYYGHFVCLFPMCAAIGCCNAGNVAAVGLIKLYLYLYVHSGLNLFLFHLLNIRTRTAVENLSHPGMIHCYFKSDAHPRQIVLQI